MKKTVKLFLILLLTLICIFSFTACNNGPHKLTLEQNAGGNISGGGSYQTRTEITVKAAPLAGYAFEGWYNGKDKVSGEMIYTFKMPNKALTLKALFYVNTSGGITTYEMTVIAGEGGTVTGDIRGFFPAGASVTVDATANQYFYFDGWYEGDTKVSAKHVYTFDMPANDLTLTAKFDRLRPTFALKVVAEEGGVALGSGAFLFGADVTVLAAANDGYDFEGWYDGETKVSSSTTYSFKMPMKPFTLTAKFKEKSE